MEPFQSSNTYVLCGNIYENGKHVAYRQIPINKIKGIKQLSDGQFELSIKSFESFEDVESANAVCGSAKEEHLTRLKKIQNIEIITLNLNDLDRYFKKKKELKEKHINAFMKLLKGTRHSTKGRGSSQSGSTTGASDVSDTTKEVLPLKVI
jgi:hypothetical protein